jgi:hypothetical protein
VVEQNGILERKAAGEGPQDDRSGLLETSWAVYPTNTKRRESVKSAAIEPLTKTMIVASFQPIGFGISRTEAVSSPLSLATDSGSSGRGSS